MTRALTIAPWLLLLAGCLPAFPDKLPGETTDPGTVPTENEDADDDGFTVAEGDCDDTNALVYPDANERCDGLDNDCNEAVDDDAVDESLFYRDGDGDGFGDEGEATSACDAPADHVSDDSDCDDDDASVNPGEDEVCDDLDNNCDGTIDDDAVDRQTWYPDLDADGFGDDSSSILACDEPFEHVAADGDCNDLAPDTHPDGTEVCGGEDEDCDGLEDDDDPSVSSPPTWYDDDDGDGFGDDSDAGTAACTQPPDTSAVQGDCDDTSDDYNPNAAETDCSDPEDYNCDGSTGFADGDGDGFAACEECNDANPDANPDELEACDAANADEDCDGAADDADPQGATGEISSFPDADLDGFGRTGAAATPMCDIVPGISANDDDCDDDAAEISPDALEVCDAADVDEDCTGTADNGDPGAVGLNTFYPDGDGDGFGDPALPPVMQCDVEPGLSAVDTDCDDARAFVNPDAPEICDAVDRDEDCDGLADDGDLQGPEGDTTTFYDDADADGFGLDASAREGCDAQGNEVEVGGDCDDADAAVNPGESEVCDPAETDEDCDGGADDADPEGATGTSTYFPDDDSDGFGDETAAGREGCQATGAEVTDASDCNDASAEAFPGALEQCNGQQDDCSVAWTSDDGVVTSEGPGGATDQSAAFNAGSPGAPAAVALPAGETVTVCPGTYTVALTAGGTTDVVGFTGVAGDVVLSGGGVDRVLTLTAGGVVSLTDLTVADGSAIDGGGALVGASDLTTDNVVFDGNTASDSGGAVAVGTGNATFTETTFTGNTADLGGAVSVAGGIVAGTGGTLTANDATTSGGGWYVSGGGLVDVTNVVTTANTATTGAGGYVADGTIDCSGVTGSFVDNVATTTGGGVELVAGSVVSNACDWAPGNLPDDVHTPLGSAFYGLNATFTCDPVTGCVP